MDSYDANLDLSSFEFPTTEYYDSWSSELTENTTPYTSSTNPSTSASPGPIETFALDGNALTHGQKRRSTSSTPESNSLARPRKTRKLRCPQETAKVREKGACYGCKLNRKLVSYQNDRFLN
jgi:hypothetical protein